VSDGLDRRLAALATAADLADGRLEPEQVEAARAVVRRAGERLGLGVEETVVALAGPTGAGKSTLLNALAGSDVARTSRLRPTTSAPTAAVWGDPNAALLDWLGVQRRHRAGDGRLDGLVVLDLPDFDSVELAHRLEVDRVIELVDLLVWVVDPQKYADGALHDRYLRPLATHGSTMVLVLNQADLLPADALAACRRDLGRLLADDGLPGLPVLPVSARTGEGLPALAELLEERVATRAAAVARLSTDVSAVATRLAVGCGEGVPGRVDGGERDRLAAALAQAAGVPGVVRAVARAHRRRGGLATGWPFVRWLRRLRPDPLRRLGLADRPRPEQRTSLPAGTPAQRGQVSHATRTLAGAAAGELPAPWPALVRSAATAREDELADRLDRAVAGADLAMSRPRWWRALGLLQILLAAAVVTGAVWLLALAGLGYLQLGDVVPVPELAGLPVPTLLLVGGALAGVLLALLARAINGLGARRRARRAQRALRARVEEVAGELVVAPVEAELAAHARLCGELAVAARAGEGRRRRIVPRLGQVAAG
jgi:GTPase Era involved in 16S rRNA processing